MKHLTKREVIEAFYAKPLKLTGSEPVYKLFDKQKSAYTEKKL